MQLLFAPRLTQYLEYACGKSRTPWGTAAISWKREHDRFWAELELPKGPKIYPVNPMSHGG